MRRSFERLAALLVGALTLLGVLAAPAAAHPGGDHRYRYVNGCTMAPDRLPGLIDLKDLCNKHDIWYARYDDGHHQFGTNELGRLRADRAFLSAMNSRCQSRFAWYDPRRTACMYAVDKYYRAVRLAGIPWYYDRNTRW